MLGAASSKEMSRWCNDLTMANVDVIALFASVIFLSPERHGSRRDRTHTTIASQRRSRSHLEATWRLHKHGHISRQWGTFSNSGVDDVASSPARRLKERRSRASTLAAPRCPQRAGHRRLSQGECESSARSTESEGDRGLEKSLLSCRVAQALLIAHRFRSFVGARENRRENQNKCQVASSQHADQCRPPSKVFHSTPSITSTFYPGAQFASFPVARSKKRRLRGGTVRCSTALGPVSVSTKRSSRVARQRLPVSSCFAVTPADV